VTAVASLILPLLYILGRYDQVRSCIVDDTGFFSANLKPFPCLVPDTQCAIQPTSKGGFPPHGHRLATVTVADMLENMEASFRAWMLEPGSQISIRLVLRFPHRDAGFWSLQTGEGG